ncbi:MAG: hypothetical protein KC502_22200 [Myxococcales bacterium]|nr:hypothetical protein [Myxococcales bacterium]
MSEPGTSSSAESGDSWVGTAEQFAWLEWLVRAILILNVLDAVFTIYWISEHKAIEANPLLAELAHEHPVAFVAVKTALVSLGSGLLWRLRRSPLAVIGIFAAFLGYYFLLIYHLNALNPQLIQRLGGG